MSGGWTGEELLARPVRLRGIQLGRPVDLVLDAETLRAVGLDVRCGDGELRFLPLAAARVRTEEVELRSALLLLDETNTAFYRRRTRTLRELRGQPAPGAGHAATLADVVFAADGTATAVVLADGRRVHATGVRVTRRDRASAV